MFDKSLFFINTAITSALPKSPQSNAISIIADPIISAAVEGPASAWVALLTFEELLVSIVES